jgi:hypothetical protein
MATRLRTRVTSLTPRSSPGRRASHDSTQSNLSPPEASWAPSLPPTARCPPERDKETPISLQDNTIMLTTPLPTTICCSTCGPSTLWSGRSCLSDTIRHFSLSHGKKSKAQIECSRCCHISHTVQAANFLAEKTYPLMEPHPGSQVHQPQHDASPPSETQLIRDRLILVHPPLPSKSPQCSWTSSGNRTDDHPCDHPVDSSPIHAVITASSSQPDNRGPSAMDSEHHT